GDLPLRRPVADVRVFEDLGEAPAAVVLADHVRRDPILLRRAGEEERERIPDEASELGHGSILWAPKASLAMPLGGRGGSAAAAVRIRFAETVRSSSETARCGALGSQA